MKLAAKIIIIQVVLTVSILLLFGIFTYVTSIIQLERNLRQEGKLSTEILAQIISISLWNFVQEEVDILMTIQLTDSRIRAVLLDDNGKISGKLKNDNGEIIPYDEGDETTKILEKSFFTRKKRFIIKRSTWDC